MQIIFGHEYCYAIYLILPRVEAGYNTPPYFCEAKKATKMKPGDWRYNWATLSLEGNKYRDLVL
jgi:hypothetical protein